MGTGFMNIKRVKYMEVVEIYLERDYIGPGFAHYDGYPIR